MNTTTTIHVNRDVKAELKRQAAEMREEFARRGTLVINVLSSPGSGKTSLLEATAKHWHNRRRMAVLVGDLATDRDAQRLAPFCPVAQLTTGGACHLEIPLVQRGLETFGTDDFEFLFIENVGNLVCPASHDLAEHLRVVLLSVTEGDDKPGKYPKMFRTSNVVVISKSDLLPYVPFSVKAAVDDARLIQHDLRDFTVCSLTGDGVAGWCRFLEETREQMIADASASATPTLSAREPLAR
ncbi:MAG: hydrogenase accessory protein HypB [Planctomycetota bacterium]|nr:MAG: hydrogenase accessory protein HypB [Planctomycetota bacterium]REJ96755.1 MAG: hydrogenase accessory protein HypB [Planctomycetota bacterium]REK25165.1 MAG: hydrogenase accessory protein HypB [Planctomycetota bacterium]REK38806.1 MAG: hydrogenase accessory protein HypB [Planctomycetota bacterium]